jgi:hypothetical protein
MGNIPFFFTSLLVGLLNVLLETGWDLVASHALKDLKKVTIGLHYLSLR